MTSEADATAIAAKLCGEAVVELQAIRRGRNSRVFRVRTRLASYALKVYPSDDRKRALRETAALRFIRGAALHAPVPNIIAGDERSVLLEWIEGTPVSEPSLGDVEAAAHLLELLHALRNHAAAAKLPEAMEATLDAKAVFEQIEHRRRRLGEIDDPRLQSFLSDQFDAAFVRAQRGRAERDPDLGHLELQRRTLSPADFGFHNAVRLTSGKLTFLDFEYFGWDDPVKTVADFLLHPGMMLPPVLAAHFRKRTAEIYGVDPRFEARLDARLPLYALRWALIVLNEFIPSLWQTRLEAGSDRDWETVKTRQLLIAHAALAAADAS